MATKAKAAKREARKISAKKHIHVIRQSHARLFRTLNGVFSIEEETPGATDKWVAIMNRKHMPCVELKTYDKVPDEKLILT